MEGESSPKVMTKGVKEARCDGGLGEAVWRGVGKSQANRNRKQTRAQSKGRKEEKRRQREVNGLSSSPFHSLPWSFSSQCCISDREAVVDG